MSKFRNKKKDIFGKDFANKFYKSYSGLTNIVRRNLVHENDYIYIKHRHIPGVDNESENGTIGSKYISKFGNGVRILLTKSCLQTVVNSIINGRNVLRDNKNITTLNKKVKLLQEYLEIAKELD